MANFFASMFDRNYYRRMEKKLEVKPIIYCWWFNFTVAVVVFAGTWLLTLNPFTTIMYTLSGWTVTLTISIIYWLSWVQRKLKGGKNVKIVASTAILVMFMIGLIFLFNAFSLVVHVAGQ